MLHRFISFIGSIVTYVFEELLDNGRTNTRLEPTIGTIKDLEEEKELPPIKLD
jgi:hypothetical protein